MTLLELETTLENELSFVNYPAVNWLHPDKDLDCAVAIVGAGMAGLTAAFELIKLGVGDLMLFDNHPEGFEGPWKTYARMPFLRSGKAIAGPALHFPSLTFQAWYLAQWGQKAWEALYKIPTSQWMDYLKWVRKVLGIPVNNGCTLLEIIPRQNHLELVLNDKGISKVVRTKKVILATGREGFGGNFIPEFVHALPKNVYAHTNEHIDFEALQGKSVAILGVGASGFDAAATALEHKAKEVTLLTRRKTIPNINKTASLSYPGCSEGFYHLSDEARWTFCHYIFKQGSPPPFEALDRIKDYPNVKVATDVQIKNVIYTDEKIIIKQKEYDYLILATGFAIDGYAQTELRNFIKEIQLWGDRPCAQNQEDAGKIAAFPYLGPHFEFTEKTPGQASYLKNIYCYNYAATVSHWNLSGDIPDIAYGAARLARGIASDFFTTDWKYYFAALQHFHKHEFLPRDYQRRLQN